MESNNKIQKVFGLDLPNHVDNFFFEFGGVQIEHVDNTQLLKYASQFSIKKLIVHENFKQNEETVVKLLEQKQIDSLIIYSLHPYWLPNILKRLETFSQTCEIHVIVGGYGIDSGPNIKVHNIEVHEHTLSHSFILLLSELLQKKRQQTVPFIMQTVFKDNFRSQIGRYLKTSKLWPYFYKISQDHTSDFLLQKRNDILQEFQQQYGSGQYLSSLKAFGNGLPNFKLYEQVFCELVLETSNTGSWHFTEKTFRPIALGTPIIHLGHKPMYDRFLSYGYKLYDNGFYNEWHKKNDLSEKLPYLENFLQHIIENKNAKIEMSKNAEHNYKIFWNERKNCYYKDMENIFQIIFGENKLTNKIYNRLDF